MEIHIRKTILNPNLRSPDGYQVSCAGMKARFKPGEEELIEQWMMAIWHQEEDPFFPEFSVFSPAYLYYDIDWDCDHVLYAKYERIS